MTDNWPSAPRWFRRCWVWRIGPFMTEWRCLLARKHQGAHLFEPDTWGTT